jgi:hypothetical protein
MWLLWILCKNHRHSMVIHWLFDYLNYLTIRLFN